MPSSKCFNSGSPSMSSRDSGMRPGQTRGPLRSRRHPRWLSGLFGLCGPAGVPPPEDAEDDDGCSVIECRCVRDERVPVQAGHPNHPGLPQKTIENHLPCYRRWCATKISPLHYLLFVPAMKQYSSRQEWYVGGIATKYIFGQKMFQPRTLYNIHRCGNILGLKCPEAMPLK